MEATFKQLDDDHSGTIEMDELEKELRKLGQQPESVIMFTAHDLRDFMRFSFGKRLIDYFREMDTDEYAAAEKRMNTSCIATLQLTCLTESGRPHLISSVAACASIRVACRSGQVSKKEWRKAIKGMGFKRATKQSIDATFDSLDGDGSGELDFLELDKQLRRLGDDRSSGEHAAASPPAPAKGRTPEKNSKRR